MVNARAPRIGIAMAVVAVVVALFILADAIVVTRLVATRFTAPPSATTSASTNQQKAGSHPCNHGFYVSQAAHAKKGGAYVRGIAQSNLGKNGSCTAPLPAKPPAAASPKTSDDQ
jgi:hypothetical protein